MAAQALLKRNKRTVAVSCREECLRSSNPAKLNDLLNYILDPEEPIDRFETIDWCRWLISGGTTFDEFAKTVKSYDNAVTCGLVWTQDFVAYRCRTCGLSPCMSLCSDCFQSSDHRGHDYNMFRSQAGGACDCGDVSVMKPQGFCGRHGPKKEPTVTPPEDLLCVSRVVLPRLVFRFLQHARTSLRPEPLSISACLGQAQQLINLLQQLSDMGAAMREVLSCTLTDSELYRTLTQCGETASDFQVRSSALYRIALESLPVPSLPEEFTDIDCVNAPLVHKNLLEELLFWTIKLEFPASLVTLLLSMLPNNQYKDAFSRAFVQHYSRIICSVVTGSNRTKTANRAGQLPLATAPLGKSLKATLQDNLVLHISVQLLSPRELAEWMVREHKLLHIMLTCLRHIIEQRLTTCALNECQHSSPLVVDCTRDVFKEHCYWPIVNDLINTLSHEEVARIFLQDQQLLIFWFDLLAYFQGMNVNQRLLHEHIEFEPDTYCTAFSAELEVCASTMWSLLAHCKLPEFKEFTQAAILVISRVLKDWLEAVGVTPFSKPQPLRGSFHLPLHRHLAMFVSTAVRCHGASLQKILPAPDVLQMILTHPLQLQVMFHEIFAGMWVRNGLQIRGQAMTYVQCHFCNSMVDADLYLLQVCGSSLDPDFFVKTVLERFHVLDLLTFAPVETGTARLAFIEPDKQMAMLEGCLTLLTMVVALRQHTGLTERGVTRMELISLLCTTDRTHSQLKELLPEKCGVTQHSPPDLETLLKQVSEYKAPVFEPGGGMQQGMYKPRAQIWLDSFDPLYVMLRSMFKKDLQNAMDRYTAYVKNRGLYRGTDAPWPPFRAPATLSPQYAGLARLLHCRTLHALLFTLLYKCLNEPGVSDAVAYFTVHLLELALTIPHPRPSNHKTANGSVPERRDKQLSTWYNCDVIDENVRQVIASVQVTVPKPDADEKLAAASAKRMRDSEAMTSMFDLAPSTLNATPGVVTNWNSDTSSEVINAVQALLEETVAQENQQPAPEPVPGSSTSRLRTASRGVSASLESHYQQIHVPLNESIITLLWKLRDKFATASLQTPNYYEPAEFCKGVANSQNGHSGASKATSSGGNEAGKANHSQGGGGAKGGGLGGERRGQRSSMYDKNSCVCEQFESSCDINNSADRATERNASGNSGISGNPQTSGNVSTSGFSGPTGNSTNSNFSRTFGNPSNSGISGTSASSGSRLTNRPTMSQTCDPQKPTGPNRPGLHRTTSGEVKTSGVTESRVGNGVFFIDKILDKLCVRSPENKDVIHALYCEAVNKSKAQTTKGKANTLEERRRRAKQRQQKLMANFAQQRKQFMEQNRDELSTVSSDDRPNMATETASRPATGAVRGHDLDDGGQSQAEVGDNEGATSAAGAEATPSNALYDCVICNMASPCTEDNPIGLVGLLQATSVLGHRTRQPGPRPLPVGASNVQGVTELGDTCSAQWDSHLKTQLQYFNEGVTGFGDTCSPQWSSHLKTQLQYFNEPSVLLSGSIGWQGGVHAQTCGHYVHLSCHKAYITSLRDDPQLTMSLKPEKGEYWCPLCRQLSNTTLPVSPNPGPALAKQLPTGERELVRWIAHNLSRSPPTPGSSPFMQALGRLMEDLTRSTDQQYSLCGASPSDESILRFVSSVVSTDQQYSLCGAAPSDESILRFVSSVVRCNLEMDMLHAQMPPLPGTLRCASTKSCLMPLLEVSSLHVKVLSKQQYAEVWADVAGSWAQLTENSRDLVLTEKKNVPVLLRDCSTMLIYLVLALPLHRQEDVFQCVVQVLFNVVYIQALLRISLEFSDEERSAWRSKVKTNAEGATENSLGAWLGRVVLFLQPSGLYEDESAADPFVPSICGQIWSPQSVECEVQRYCLSFLRLAGQLSHHLHGTPLPEGAHKGRSEEFSNWCHMLGLAPSCPSVWESSDLRPHSSPGGHSGGQGNCGGQGHAGCRGLADLQLSSQLCLKWCTERPVQLVQGWCTQLQEMSRRLPQTARMLLTPCLTWHPPHLLQLPTQYERIFDAYRSRACASCKSLPQDPALCLVCGAFVCSKEICCERERKLECVQHANSCGAGVGVFLLVLSSYIILIRGPRAAVWGSVYLDQHGEEDRDLKRGKPLYLSEERYRLLRHQWLTHSFDRAAKRWSLHRDQL